MSHKIFTNNSVLADYIKQQPEMTGYELVWMSAPAMEVLVAVRAAVRQGAVLVSNPLSGVRMSQSRADKKTQGPKRGGFTDKPLSFGGRPVAFNPYVSVLVTPPQDSVDFQSVKRIDEAVAVYKKNAGLRFSGRSDESIKQFQITDMDALMSVLTEIREQKSEDRADEENPEGS